MKEVRIIGQKYERSTGVLWTYVSAYYKVLSYIENKNFVASGK